MGRSVDWRASKCDVRKNDEGNDDNMNYISRSDGWLGKKKIYSQIFSNVRYFNIDLYQGNANKSSEQW